jgi:hypothetical protein
VALDDLHDPLRLRPIPLADCHNSTTAHHLQWTWYHSPPPCLPNPLADLLSGTCVPLCVAAYLLRALLLSDSFYRPHIVFTESYCRVRSLSLSGRLLYPIADRFVVQWPDAAVMNRYPRAQFIGKIC